jgi:hypothetical protein
VNTSLRIRNSRDMYKEESYCYDEPETCKRRKQGFEFREKEKFQEKRMRSHITSKV